HADFCKAEIKDGIAEIAWAEIKFFPKAGRDVRNMRFAIFAEVGAVIVNDGSGVVVDAFGFDFIEGDDEGDAEFGSEFLHELGGGAAGNWFGEVVPAGGLLRAKVRAVKDFLEADDLRTVGSGLADHGDVLIEHDLLDFVERAGGRFGVGGLDEGAADNTRHEAPWKTRKVE